MVVARVVTDSEGDRMSRKKEKVRTRQSDIEADDAKGAATMNMNSERECEGVYTGAHIVY